MSWKDLKAFSIRIALIGLVSAVAACSTLDFGPEPGSMAYDQYWCEEQASRAPVGGSSVNPPPDASSSWSEVGEQAHAGNRGECEHAAGRRAELAGVDGESS